MNDEFTFSQSIIAHLENDYSSFDKMKVIQLLDEVKPEHVMAGSEYNLLNTRYSILYLAKGDVAEVAQLVECAKIDFRDVIYWATMEKEATEK
ncbi:MAG: hypothetical protein OEZ39_09150 [Gammaproteobacteria bacterium]|nr:hypothetical protein [Gammaproteobacteria bacterium]MDH5652010.1 hypothetical protein [Gammaproteobacteria bacterium]